MVQPIVEDELGEAGAPLWEPGISTEEYEERLDRSGLGWAIRAKAGRSRGTILARLAMSAEHPATLLLVCSQDSFPESLFDANKLALFLSAQGTEGPEGLMSGLLLENGFQPAAI